MRENTSSSRSTSLYPSGDDVEWVAVDRHGRIGVFTTAGEGPIARAYLQSSELLGQVGKAIWALAEHSEAVLLEKVARPDDFLAFARRGCFAFDWIIGHQRVVHASRYELQARPATPRPFTPLDWPEDLRSVLKNVRSDSLDFQRETVDVSVLGCDQAS